MIGLLRRRRIKGFGDLPTRLLEWEKAGLYRLDELPSEAASRLGTDIVQLDNYCLKVFGEEFRSWRKRIRLEEAGDLLLKEPGLPVYKIGILVGFAERGNFTREFTRYCGRTPSEWRKRFGTKPDGRDGAGPGRP